MVTRGEQLAERIIQDDLECLSCGYNLRGLSGGVVHCPECGVVCDIPRMIANRWTGPWQQAPGYPTLIAPLAWLVIGGMPLFLVFAYEMQSAHRDGLYTGLLALLLIGGWGYLLQRARRLFDDDRAVTLSLLAHALFIAYLLGIFLTIWGFFRATASGEWSTAALHLLAMFGGAALVIAARRGERYIAQWCIKRYVLRRSTPDAASE